MTAALAHYLSLNQDQEMNVNEKRIAQLLKESRFSNRLHIQYFQRYPDNCPNGDNPEWTPSRMDTIPNGHNPEWTPSQMDTIPNGHNPKWTQSRMSTYIVT